MHRAEKPPFTGDFHRPGFHRVGRPDGAVSRLRRFRPLAFRQRVFLAGPLDNRYCRKVVKLSPPESKENGTPVCVRWGGGGNRVSYAKRLTELPFTHRLIETH